MNVATAEAMQGPPEKHLARRQQYFTYTMQDILYHSYLRAAELRSLPPLPYDNYERLFKVTAPDVSARDNNLLATAAGSIANALQSLETLLQSNTNDDFKSLVLDLILKFAGERPEEKDLKTLIQQPTPLPPSREVQQLNNSLLPLGEKGWG